MATFRISSSGAPGTLPSVFTSSGNAFSSDTALADTLIVDAGAFLVTSDALGTGAFLNATGAWTATVNGSVHGSVGLFLGTGIAATSTINVGVDGSIRGDGSYGVSAFSSSILNNSGTIAGEIAAIALFGGATHTITNAGTIRGNTAAILEQTAASSDTVTNTGTILGDVLLGDGTNTLTNAGSLTGDVSGGVAADTITNSGNLIGFVDLGGGTNRLTNSGNILAGDVNGSSVVAGSGADTVSNTKFIGGGVLIGGSSDTFANTLTNSGTIGGNFFSLSYGGGAGIDTVTNSGKMLGLLAMGDGANTVFNRGSIGERISDNHSYEGGTGADTIFNAVRVGKKAFGGAIGGDVLTGDGADTVTDFITFKVKVGKVLKTVTANGHIDGTVDLGVGNDHFNGGAFAETVKDNDGSDTVNFSGGNDSYIAVNGAGADGTDVVDGGKGTDTYDASGATGQVFINLDTVDHQDTLINATPITKSTATGADVSDGLKDTITGFENALGGGASDVLFGTSGANFLNGNGGDDDLWGLAGSDTLDGGANQDFLIGGAGRDVLTGGLDPDAFVFLSTTDSGVTAATRDLITDFAADGPLGDRIELSRIDANTTNAANTNDAFTFIGTNVNWGGVAGELRAYWIATGQVIEGDVNGDKIADFSIEIADPTHAITLSGVDSVDFVL